MESLTQCASDSHGNPPIFTAPDKDFPTLWWGVKAPCSLCPSSKSFSVASLQAQRVLSPLALDLPLSESQDPASSCWSIFFPLSFFFFPPFSVYMNWLNPSRGESVFIFAEALPREVLFVQRSPHPWGLAAALHWVSAVVTELTAGTTLPPFHFSLYPRFQDPGPCGSMPPTGGRGSRRRGEWGHLPSFLFSTGPRVFPELSVSYLRT